MDTLLFVLLLGTSSLAAAITPETDSRRSDATYPERISNLQAKAAHEHRDEAISVRADAPLSIVDLVRQEAAWVWVGEDVERLRVRRLR